MKRVEPEGWYERRQLAGVGIDAAEAEAARRAGQLLARRAGGRTFFKGAELIKWLARIIEARSREMR